MNILLFGGSGQLGNDIILRAADLHFKIVAPVISELNIADRDQVLFLTKKIKPDVIINSAAYTNVDGAEDHPKEAFESNRDGALNAAIAAKTVNAKLIHISTDYVFDGSKQSGYVEQDKTSPLGVYGQSKLEGELAVLEEWGRDSFIVRTAWLHGRGGANFVQTMIRLFKEHETVKVVSDQFGSPTWSGWLAEVLLDLVRVLKNENTGASGIVHAACQGNVSWFDFANTIYELIKPKIAELKVKAILPQTTEECGRKAGRPKYSVLDCSRLKSIIGRAPISWQDGLKGHLSELGY